jgi:hypothetical protein
MQRRGCLEKMGNSYFEIEWYPSCMVVGGCPQCSGLESRHTHSYTYTLIGMNTHTLTHTHSPLIYISTHVGHWERRDKHPSMCQQVQHFYNLGLIWD